MLKKSIQFESRNETLDRAFRIALGDYAGNIQPWRSEEQEATAPCILAGLDYDKPWTRDAAFNSWYAGSLLTPEVAKNTLMAVLTRDEAGWRIGGEYWDAIVWVTAAWNHYLCTGDRNFLEKALAVSENSLRYFEQTERDEHDGLFRGGACFQDGVAGYPDRFADGPTSGIADWVKAHPSEKALRGHGLPMKALSTNCLYYHAYCLLPAMAKELGRPVDAHWDRDAKRLRDAINHRFWNQQAGTYRYLVDAGDDPERQEGFGHAFALLFGIADDAQAASVLQHQHLTAHGIACVWPTYQRYADNTGMSFGRHAGVIWPQVNAAWAMATCSQNRQDLGWREMTALADKACRDHQFLEIYHPVTGEGYGGMQESVEGGRIVAWTPCNRQTWCATGYVRMMLATLFGFEVDVAGATFSPWLPASLTRVCLSGLPYRNALITITVERAKAGGEGVILINGKRHAKAVVDAQASGPQTITVMLPGTGTSQST